MKSFVHKNGMVEQNAAEVLEWADRHPLGTFHFRRQQDGEYVKLIREVNAGRLHVCGEGKDHMVIFSRTSNQERNNV